MVRPKVLAAPVALGPASPERVAELEAHCDVTRLSDFRAEMLADDLRDTQGLLVNGAIPVTAELLDALPDLRIVSVRAVGYDRVDVSACGARNVTVTHTPGVLDGAVADLTVLLILGAARKINENLAAARGPWAEQGWRPPLGTDVRGRTLGVVGMGRIGLVVARTMQAGFGMRVLYHNRHPVDGCPWAEHVTREQLFAESDIVSVHAPLTDSTRNIVGVNELGRMKRGAILVNTSRGALVDEVALVTALDEGRIAGAALDVLATEPFPADHPLQGRPNVLLTPHIGSATVETRRAMSDLAVRNLLVGLAGREPEAVIPELQANVA